MYDNQYNLERVVNIIQKQFVHAKVMDAQTHVHMRVVLV